MKNIIIIAALSVLLAACSGSKNTTVEEQLKGAPGWVRINPNDPVYYHGVGSAVKSNQMDYKEKARQNALSEMAGNISVNIASSSVLGQFEFDQKFSEYYRDNIKVTAKSYLEGYEMVDSWENSDRYWVYYRISKSEYERIRQQRIQTAQLKSEGDYREFRRAMQSGQSADAMASGVRAIENIRDFLGENLQTTTDGKQESYTSRLFADLNSALQETRITFSVPVADLKRGQRYAGPPIQGVVRNGAGLVQAGIPVVVTYSYQPGRREELISDAGGSFRIDPGVINTRNKTESITATVNFGKIVKDATGDPVIRKMLAGMKTDGYNLQVNLLPAVFHVMAAGTDPSFKNFDDRLQKEITDMIAGEGYQLTSTPADADIRIQVEPRINGKSEGAGRTSVTLSALFSVSDKSGGSLFSQQLSDITGLAPQYLNAVDDAYRALSARIRISTLPAMYKAITVQ